jgi:TrmH family RNA methyltransferase
MSEEAQQAADVLVKIPMEGGSESLNASMAAGVMMYEAYRQKTYGK